MVTVTQLQYQYPGGRLMTYPDFTASGPSPLLITGKSGSGKTTLLHLLAALIPVQAGHIQIGQTDIATLSQKQADQFRGEHIGLVLQQHHFVQSISAGENIRLAAWLAGKKMDASHQKQLVASLGIADLLHRLPAQLSLGEQQRVSIARALINRPSVLLADEPTSSLDDDNAATVIELLSGLSREIGSTLLVVTHDARLKPFFDNTIHLL